MVLYDQIWSPTLDKGIFLMKSILSYIEIDIGGWRNLKGTFMGMYTNQIGAFGAPVKFHWKVYR